MSLPLAESSSDLKNPTSDDCHGQQDCQRFEELRNRHLAEARELLDEAVSRLDWSREQILAHQTSRLRQMVDHAKKNSPYYTKKLAHVNQEALHASDLTALPVLTKDDVMKHWDDIVTDRRVKLADVTKHLDEFNSGRKRNPYYLDEYSIFATGGTSGTRGVFLIDWEMVKVNASMVYRWEAKFDRSKPPHAKKPKRTALICATSLTHVSRNLFPMFMKLDPERELRVFSASIPVKKLVELLNAYQPDRITGYASLFEDLAHRTLRGDLTITPEWITAISEPLEDSAREVSKKAWGINIHNTYGTTEFLLGAYDSPTFDSMCLAEDNVIIEVVDENYHPVTDVEKGDRILVTRLYGGTFPLIRYEVADMLVLSDEMPHADEPAPGVRRVKRIEGRTDVRFEYDGNIRVHPIVFRSVLVRYSSVTEYQVQQTCNGAHVLIIKNDTFDEQELKSKLEKALVVAGLVNPVVKVEIVHELPRHAETNKLKKFVPLQN